MNDMTSQREVTAGRNAVKPTTALAREARDRSALLSLLAGFFRTEPDASTLLAFREKELRESLEQSGVLLDEPFFNQKVEQLAEDLAVDYANLFLVPGLMISPHESVQLKGGSGLLRGPETAEVRDYYERTGFQVDDSTPMEPDHISIELEYLAHLAMEEAAAQETGNAKKTMDAMRYQEDFIGRHLGRWVFDFCNRVRLQSGHSFYKEIARLMSDYIEDLQNSLRSEIKEQAQAGN